ncbi:MAG: helix-turn-helix domain-containing protein, partial [Candidatus Lokiarchaeota archaeon]|nr:helix-turn-helix domain-containing protein [Candidatus Lokiarchaeota archaeon]
MKPTRITRTDISADKMWEMYKHEHDGRMKERYHCIAMMLDGGTAGEVARSFHCSRNTTWEWAVAYNEGGLEGLKRESPPGLKSRLSDEQKAALKEDLKKSPRELGYPFAIWT